MEHNTLADYATAVKEVTTSVLTRAERDAEAKAALILKNKERLRQQTMARVKKAKAKKLYEDQKEFHAQVGLAATEMLQQFINELKGLMLVPVGDMRDREAVGRRKDQIDVIKETLSAVQLLMKFQGALAEEYDIKKSDAKDGQGENVVLFKAAERLLKQAN